MSIQAVSWALAQDIAISSAKFVLVCLANYSDLRGVCYPSQAQLCDDTGQDRKTVQLNVSRLVKTGLLRDTGHRIGATRSVVVYKIIGIPESSTRHYVYRTFEPSTGEFYIGKRSVDGDPRLDEYRGSGKWVLDKLSKGATLVKEVVSEHMTSAEAIAAEQVLQRQVQHDPLCKNDGTPLRHRESSLRYFKKAAENREKRDSFGQDRENRDSLDIPLFPESDPKNGDKLPQKRGAEPLGTVKEPSKEPSCAEPPSDSPPFLVIPLVGKQGEFTVTEADVAQWAESFPGIDVRQLLRKIRQWNIDNPAKRKTKSGIRGHISRWLGKEQDAHPTAAGPSIKPVDTSCRRQLPGTNQLCGMPGKPHPVYKFSCEHCNLKDQEARQNREIPPGVRDALRLT